MTASRVPGPCRLIGLLALAAALGANAQDPGLGAGERLAAAASVLAAARLPYVEGALGGPRGPEHGGLPRAGLDCVTFLEASLLRAGGVEDPIAQDRWLRASRYDDREPAYCTRLHYMSDWVSRNAAHGWLREITADLAQARQLTLRTRGWSRGFLAAHDQDPARCAGGGDDTVAYVGPEDYDRIADQLQAGDILLLVASKPGLDTAHLGILQADGALAMASSIERHTLVQPDWRAYARQRASRFAGVRVLRVAALPTVTP